MGLVSKKGNRFLVLLTLGILWSSITLGLDFVFIFPIVRQHLAANYPSTQGSILFSRAVTIDSEDGGSNLEVGYAYSAQGTNYSGFRHNYHNRMLSECCWAEGFAESHPPGSIVEVFYNPRDPSDAVLKRGVTGADLFFFTFMAPFNCVMIGFWLFGFEALYFQFCRSPIKGVSVFSKSGKTIVRMTECSAWFTAITLVGLLSFASLFLILMVAGDNPPLQEMKILWLAILGCAVFGRFLQKYINLSGKYDLVIDDLNSRIELPLTHGRKTRTKIPFCNVQKLWVETVVKSQTEDDAPVLTFAPSLSHSENKEKTERLAIWANEIKANECIQWLQERLSGKC